MACHFNCYKAIFCHLNKIFNSIPTAIPLLVLRFALAIPFFRSGKTKWDGFFVLSDSARYLFESEFKIHLFGHMYAYPFPDVMAKLAGSAEIIFPILLVLGLATRFSAFSLLIMTGVIQLTIPDGWANFHLPWAAMALTLVVYGGGNLSLDYIFGKVCTKKSCSL